MIGAIEDHRVGGSSESDDSADWLKLLHILSVGYEDARKQTKQDTEYSSHNRLTTERWLPMTANWIYVALRFGSRDPENSEADGVAPEDF
jgi:hypothetical protein